jgi:lactate racemase
MTMVGKGSVEGALNSEDVRQLILSGIPQHLYDGKRVLVLTPDGTRTCPLPMMVGLIREIIGSRASRLDFMVALGTHPLLSQQDIRKLYGVDPVEASWGNSSFFNHEWNQPGILRCVDRLSAEEVRALSGGLLSEEVKVLVNSRIYEYDLVLVAGPVFPHEVVGFSGGAKYLFPGISGGEFLHFFHWLGAVITCMKTIGRKDTPVRRVIHRAMKSVTVPARCIAMVVDMNCGLKGLYAGGMEDAWEEAATLSSKIHVVTRDRAYRTVLGRAPAMYDELWTAGKVMYKLEQVVADQGRLIIYAPHVREISRTWGAIIEKIGYHTRDYFLERMEEYRDIPRGVLAHLTHVRGTGAMLNGVERPRIEVVLATGIPEAKCTQVNLGYMNPAEIRISDYVSREEESILFVDHAGEILYKLAG